SIHGGSSVESGLELGTLRSRCRDLTTKTPQNDLDLEKTTVSHEAKTLT
ncbi:hypothetical protein AVEN_31727-1, partial [Araneus ventricosus]